MVVELVSAVIPIAISVWPRFFFGFNSKPLILLFFFSVSPSFSSAWSLTFHLSRSCLFHSVCSIYQSSYATRWLTPFIVHSCVLYVCVQFAAAMPHATSAHNASRTLYNYFAYADDRFFCCCCGGSITLTYQCRWTPKIN